MGGVIERAEKARMRVVGCVIGYFKDDAEELLK